MIDLGGFECFPIGIAVLFLFRMIGLTFGGGRDESENDQVIAELNRAIPAAQDEATRNLTARVPSYRAQDALAALKKRYVYDGQYYRWKR